MVSALEGISHIPFLLAYIFGDEFSARQMKFKVTFKQKNGKSEFFYILNNFPVNIQKELVYMKPLKKEAYAIIFEKVWAVVRRGYKNIEGGFTYEVLNRVLGTSATYLYNDNMKIFDLDPYDYIKRMKLPNTYSLYKEIAQQIQEVKESDINYINSNPSNTINSKESFKLIREAEKKRSDNHSIY